MKPLAYCKSCKRYTLEALCPLCNAPTINPIPAKYSPQDKYAKYRRQYKLENQEKEL